MDVNDLALLGTNLADVGTDTISRQAAIDAADKIIERDTSGSNAVVNAMIAWSEYIRALPSAQPEIVYCKDCKWWTKQEDSLQGRCALLGSYPTGRWYCANAKKRRPQ